MNWLYVPFFVIRFVRSIVIKWRIRTIALTVGLERSRLLQVFRRVIALVGGHRVNGYFIWRIFFSRPRKSLGHLMTYVVFSIARAIVKGHIRLECRVVGLNGRAWCLWVLFKVVYVRAIATERVAWGHVASVVFYRVNTVQVPWSVVGFLNENLCRVGEINY